jgi:signal recognition particle receptor subunit beta
MADFDGKNKKLVVKAVYYGPALSGKTTNLMQLHDILDPSGQSDLMTFETKGDRTLFFDLLPIVGATAGSFTIKLKLFTVPGQVAHDATRKAVLSRADAVVFVADSQVDKAMGNFESFDNLEKNAGRVGLDFERLPLVIQFNKRDLKNVVPEEEILERWGPTNLPVVFGSAIKGEGVEETFRTMLYRVHEFLEARYRMKGRYGITRSDFMNLLR